MADYYSLRLAHDDDRECLQDLAEVFTELILEDQDCFATEEGYEALLKLLPVPDVVDALRTKWSADPTRASSEKWTDLKAQIKKSSEKVGIPHLILNDVDLALGYIDGSTRRYHSPVHLSSPRCRGLKT